MPGSVASGTHYVNHVTAGTIKGPEIALHYLHHQMVFLHCIKVYVKIIDRF